MDDMQTLAGHLKRIDGRGYKAYRDIRGRFEDTYGVLCIDHVQADPFAPPSRLRMRVPFSATGVPEDLRAPGPAAVAARDWLARAFRRAAEAERAVHIDAGAQTVLDRTAVVFDADAVELRFTVALPARGRTILGQQARRLLCECIPRFVRETVSPESLSISALRHHCQVVEDQAVLRQALAVNGLVAFVADGSVLPRKSGIDDRPAHNAVAFQAPPERRVTLRTPHAGEISGLGIPRGVTLIVGGGFHGKSTLLKALETGVWNHMPGDGRERVVTDASAVKIRAEDGRAVHRLDLSPYIDNLPTGYSTRVFSTELASGSTSQAAALQEALEAGAQALLLDEDTCATNFMIRDRRMQMLVAREDEPITPFLDRVRQLHERLNVSTVLVMGGSGDYFEVADTVIQMRAYEPLEVTDEARRIAAAQSTDRHVEAPGNLELPPVRAVVSGSLDPHARPGKRRVQAHGVNALAFGRDSIQLGAVEQIADPAQVRAIGLLLSRLGEQVGKVSDPPAWLRHVLATNDWYRLAYYPDGDLARPRVVEVMAALSRLRSAVFEP